MSSVDKAQQMQSVTDRPRFRAFEINGWDALGHSVRLELSPRRTVLVGHNGAGKSILLEGILGTARAATRGIGFPPGQPLGPTGFACEIEDISGVLRYEASWQDAFSSGEILPSDSARSRIKWEETCTRSDGSVVWTMRRGKASFADGTIIAATEGGGMLSLALPLDIQVPDEVKSVGGMLSGITRVIAGAPRASHERSNPVLLQLRLEGHPQRLSIVGMGRADSRIRRLAVVITRWQRADQEPFNEFVELCRRVGIAYEVSVTSLRPSRQNSTSAQDDGTEFVEVRFDGVNIGLLSDGTLRTAEILLAIAGPGELLLIEEPETGVHLGLNKRVLALLESYSLQRQIVLSTHSIQVVNWARPEEIRLVARPQDKTTVRSLTPEEIGKLSAYLDDDSTLGEFIYQGGIDD